MRRKHATYVPPGAICAKCGNPIEPGSKDGRRYRMKWRPIICLPQTRRKKISLIGAALHLYSVFSANLGAKPIGAKEYYTKKEI